MEDKNIQDNEKTINNLENNTQQVVADKNLTTKKTKKKKKKRSSTTTEKLGNLAFIIGLLAFLVGMIPVVSVFFAVLFYIFVALAIIFTVFTILANDQFKNTIDNGQSIIESVTALSVYSPYVLGGAGLLAVASLLLYAIPTNNTRKVSGIVKNSILLFFCIIGIIFSTVDIISLA